MRTEVILIDGKWVKVNAETPEWQKYYEDMKRWKESKSCYASETDWYLFQPNKPKYDYANNH